ncbi:U-box domain-containing protein 19-like [Primulina eburnea]|uniref:U-box domain-containing protein 19-like n=1 Tax=Primulina eburnea TaxID=1245227 RepID=UPI003C6C701A
MALPIDRNNRRILRFPAVRPCEAISPETLLESLITISRSICSFKSKFFASQRRNSRESIRQIEILSILFEEIRDHFSGVWNPIILCLSELHQTFQMIQFLMEDCTREGARFWILMKSYSVSSQFQVSIRSIATALDVLPLNSIEVPYETKELVEMLSKQARKAKFELEPGDEEAMKRVILLMNQFENKFEPDHSIIKKILDYLGIKTWDDCHKEIKFLNEEIEAECVGCDEREVPLLSSLLGLLSYCRGIIFEDSEFSGILDQTDGRNNNLETLSCLNPEDFLCPISLELMTDPVTVSTGQTYNQASIQKWLKSGNLLCPVTGEKLTSTEMVPNTNLRKLIEQFCAEYGVSLEKSRKKNRDISRTILPGSPTNEESIKFLSRFLTSKLWSGTDYQKNKAAHEIRLLSKSNLFNRSCLIESGCVPHLLDLLHSTDPATQENVMSALLKLSKQPNGQKVIMRRSKGLNAILGVLKTGLKLESRQIAAATIFYLCSTHENRKIIGENQETIPALLELIKEGTPCGQKNSMVALFALQIRHRNRQRAIESGAVPVLLNLLSSCNRFELITDTLAVLSILADNITASIEILEAASLSLILRQLQTIETRAGKEYCISILHSLCLNCGEVVVSILAKDAHLMSVLYSIISDGTSSHANKIARSLTKILHRFSETRDGFQIEELRQEQFIGV